MLLTTGALALDGAGGSIKSTRYVLLGAEPEHPVFMCLVSDVGCALILVT